MCLPVSYFTGVIRLRRPDTHTHARAGAHAHTRNTHNTHLGPLGGQHRLDEVLFGRGGVRILPNDGDEVLRPLPLGVAGVAVDVVDRSGGGVDLVQPQGRLPLAIAGGRVEIVDCARVSRVDH